LPITSVVHSGAFEQAEPASAARPTTISENFLVSVFLLEKGGDPVRRSRQAPPFVP